MSSRDFLLSASLQGNIHCTPTSILSRRAKLGILCFFYTIYHKLIGHFSCCSKCIFSKTQSRIVLEIRWFILVILIKFGEIMDLFEIKQSYSFF